MRMSPERVGVHTQFLKSFLSDWAKGVDAIKYSKLDKYVVAGHYDSSLSDFMDCLRQTMPYNVATYVLESLLRMGQVVKTLTFNNKKKNFYSRITFPLSIGIYDLESTNDFGNGPLF